MLKVRPAPRRGQTRLQLRRLWVGAFFLLLLPASEVTAQRSRYSRAELETLPRSCLAQRFIVGELDRNAVSPVEREQWERRMGKSYLHYHHYCWGLLDMRRFASDQAQQRLHLKNALNNFSYVIRNSLRDFPMLPEVYLRRGMVQRLMENDSDAARSFREAIDVKPDYTPAYAALVDLFLDLDDLEGARGILDAGLARAPESRILKAKQLELEDRHSEK